MFRCFAILELRLCIHKTVRETGRKLTLCRLFKSEIEQQLMDFSHGKVLSLTDFLSEPLANILICHYTATADFT